MKGRLGLLLVPSILIYNIFHRVYSSSVSAEEVCVVEENNSKRNNNHRPQLLRNGQLEYIQQSSFTVLDRSSLGGNCSVSVARIPGGETINLQYVKQFISINEIDQLIHTCDDRNGWTNSYLNYDGTMKVAAPRTSSSCPMIWPLAYLPKLDVLKSSGRLKSSIEDEINFSWKLMQRIASFLNVDESYIEPLQLIRYNPGQFYRQHHDHGSYYNADTEQRPITFLIFLSSVVPQNDGGGGGGYTSFKKLNISIVPNAGDGIVWSNVDDFNNILEDALHEGVAPKDDSNVVKYALNVWIAKDPIMKNLNSAVYRT